MSDARINVPSGFNPGTGHILIIGNTSIESTLFADWVYSQVKSGPSVIVDPHHSEPPRLFGDTLTARTLRPDLFNSPEDENKLFYVTHPATPTPYIKALLASLKGAVDNTILHLTQGTEVMKVVSSYIEESPVNTIMVVSKTDHGELWVTPLTNPSVERWEEVYLKAAVQAGVKVTVSV